MGDGVFTNDIPRDDWGRPLILQNSGKRAPYRRTTKFISILEDTYSLDQWRKRMVALGMGQREDLCLSAASLSPAPEDKDALNKVAEQALEHARASSAATVGTSLHKLCERLDRGQTLGPVPSAFQADLQAYQDLRAKMIAEWGHIEVMRVFDPYKVAGTPDRTGRIGHKWYIIDIKTGDVDWNNTQREIAMQLAMYSRATPYSEEKGRYQDLVPVDRDRGLVLHLPAGQGKCEPHWVDLKVGWDGCLLAQQVWEWRKRKGIFESAIGELTPPAPANHLEKLAENPTFVESALVAPDLDALRALWKQAANHPGALSPQFMAAAKKRAAELDALAQAAMPEGGAA